MQNAPRPKGTPTPNGVYAGSLLRLLTLTLTLTLILLHQPETTAMFGSIPIGIATTVALWGSLLRLPYGDRY